MKKTNLFLKNLFSLIKNAKKVKALFVMAALCLFTNAWGTQYFWVGTSGSSWTDPASWVSGSYSSSTNSGTYPGSSADDIAVFGPNKSKGVQIELDSNINVARIIIANEGKADYNTGLSNAIRLNLNGFSIQSDWIDYGLGYSASNPTGYSDKSGGSVIVSGPGTIETKTLDSCEDHNNYLELKNSANFEISETLWTNAKSSHKTIVTGDSLSTFTTPASFSGDATDTNGLEIQNDVVVSISGAICSVSPEFSEDTESTVTIKGSADFDKVYLNLEILNSDATTAEKYTINGTEYSASTTSIEINFTTAAITQNFAIKLPAQIDSGDGFKITIKNGNTKYSAIYGCFSYYPNNYSKWNGTGSWSDSSNWSIVPSAATKKVYIKSGTLTLTGDNFGSLTSLREIIIEAGATLDFGTTNQSFSNSMIINGKILCGSGTVVFKQGLSSNTESEIDLQTATVTFKEAVTNNGTIKNSGGTVVFKKKLSSNGTLNFESGKVSLEKSFSPAGKISTAGTLNLKDKINLSGVTEFKAKGRISSENTAGTTSDGTLGSVKLTGDLLLSGNYTINKIDTSESSADATVSFKSGSLQTFASGAKFTGSSSKKLILTSSNTPVNWKAYFTGAPTNTDFKYVTVNYSDSVTSDGSTKKELSLISSDENIFNGTIINNSGWFLLSIYWRGTEDSDSENYKNWYFYNGTNYIQLTDNSILSDATTLSKTDIIIATADGKNNLVIPSSLPSWTFVAKSLLIEAGKTIEIYSPFTVSTNENFTNNGTIKIGATGTISAGSNDFGTASKIEYTSTGPVSINSVSGNGIPDSIPNVTVDSNVTLTLSKILTCSGTFSNNETVKLSSYDLTSTGTFNNNGTVEINGTGNFSVTTPDTDSGLVEYSYTGGTDASPSVIIPEKFYNLKIKNGIWETTASNINGTLDIENGAILKNKNNNMQVTGLTTVSGSFKPAKLPMLYGGVTIETTGNIAPSVSNCSIHIRGDWNNKRGEDGFTGNVNGYVRFTNTGSSVKGTNKFTNMEFAVNGGSITFENANTFTGTTTFSGNNSTITFNKTAEFYDVSFTGKGSKIKVAENETLGIVTAGKFTSTGDSGTNEEITFDTISSSGRFLLGFMDTIETVTSNNAVSVSNTKIKNSKCNLDISPFVDVTAKNNTNGGNTKNWFSAPLYWIGKTDSSWNTISNWIDSTGTKPSVLETDDKVSIGMEAAKLSALGVTPTTKTLKILSTDNASGKSISVVSGWEINCNGQNLKAEKTITNNGKISGNGSTLYAADGITNNGTISLTGDEKFYKAAEGTVKCILSTGTNSLIIYDANPASGTTATIAQNWITNPETASTTYENLTIGLNNIVQLGNNSATVNKILSNDGTVEINGTGNFNFGADGISDTNSGLFLYSYNNTNGSILPGKFYNLEISNGKWTTNTSGNVYGTLTVSGGELNFQNNYTVSGNVEINSGAKIIALGDYTLSIGGNFVNGNGLAGYSYTSGQNPQVTLTGTGTAADPVSVSGKTKFANLSYSPSGTNGFITFADEIQISGNTIFAGGGSSIAFSKVCTFNNLTITDNGTGTAGTTVTFTPYNGNSENLYKIAGKITLTGTTGKLINLKSSTAGSRFWISIPSSSDKIDVNFAKITDSKSVNKIYTWINPAEKQNVNGGNTKNWFDSNLYWVGSTDSTWDNLENWRDSANSKPSEYEGDETVFVGKASFTPNTLLLSADTAKADSITVLNGWTFSCNGKIITASQGITNNGTISLTGDEKFYKAAGGTESCKLSTGAKSLIVYDANPASGTTATIAQNWITNPETASTTYENLTIGLNNIVQLGNNSATVNKILSNDGTVEINGTGNFNFGADGIPDTDSGTFNYSFTGGTDALPAEIIPNDFFNLKVTNGIWKTDGLSLTNNLSVSSGAKLINPETTLVGGNLSSSGTIDFKKLTTIDGTFAVSGGSVSFNDLTVKTGDIDFPEGVSTNLSGSILTQGAGSKILLGCGTVLGTNSLSFENDVTVYKTLSIENAFETLFKHSVSGSGCSITTGTGKTTFMGDFTCGSALFNCPVFADGTNITITSDLPAGTGFLQFNDKITSTGKITVSVQSDCPIKLYNHIESTGAQIFNGDIKLFQDINFIAGTSDAPATVSFNGKVDDSSAETHSISVGNSSIKSSALFNGPTGSLLKPAALSVSGDATVNEDISAVSVNFESNVYGSTFSISGTTITVNGGKIETSGNQRWDGSLQLGNDTNFTAGSAGSAASITFDGTVNGTAGDSYSVSLGSSSTETEAIFNKDVGSVNEFVNLYFWGPVKTGNSTASITAKNLQLYKNSLSVENNLSIIAEKVQFDSDISAANKKLSVFAETYFAGNSTIDLGTGSLSTGTATNPKNLFVTSTGTINLSSNLKINGNFALLHGTLIPDSGLSIEVLKDLILLNGQTSTIFYDSDSGITDLFAYNNASRTGGTSDAGTATINLAEFPSTLPDGNSISTQNFTGKILNLGGQTFTASGNFYSNGLDLNGNTSWNLVISSNENALSSFAEFYNGEISFCKVQSNNSSAAYLSACENVTDGGNTTNVFFSRPEISITTKTVYDNVIKIDFIDSISGNATLIENSNNEISKLIKSITYSNGNRKFSGSYTDSECTVSTDGKGDLSSFFIKTSQNDTWNTDATGKSSGASESTNLSGSHQTNIPSVSISKVYGEKYSSLKDNHKNRISTVAFTDTLDRCAPVLIKAKTGQENHTAPGIDQLPYDSHNFIEFTYSEPVNIGSTMTLAAIEAASDADNLNLRADSVIGKTENLLSGVSIKGLAEISEGKLTTGTNGNNDSTVHSLYRKFAVSNGAVPVFHNNKIRFALAGFVDNPSLTIDGKIYQHWLGYIDSKNSKMISGTVSSENAVSTVSDAAGNFLIAKGTENHPIKAVSVDSDAETGTVYGTWDLSAPVFAKYKTKFSDSGYSHYEALGTASPTDLSLSRVEFHIFDNDYDYYSDLNATWLIKKGWHKSENSLYTSDSYAADIFGGSRPFASSDRTSGGVRYSSLYNKSSAFKYSSVLSPVQKNFNSANITGGAKGIIFLTNSSTTHSTGAEDGLYFGVYFDDPAMLLSSRLKITYSETGCITDLAGNLLRSNSEIETIDHTPPNISLSIGALPDGNNSYKELYLLLNKRIESETITIYGDDHVNKEINVLEYIPKCLRFVTISDSGTEQPVSDLYIENVKIRFENENYSSLIVKLNRSITLEDMKTVYLQCNVPETSCDPLTGSSDAYVSYIQDELGNYLTNKNVHLLSDFAINSVLPVYAYDNRVDQSGSNFSAKLLSNSDYTVRNWNAEQKNSGTLIYGEDLFIVANLYDGTEDRTNLPEKVFAYMDSSPDSEAVSKIYNDSVTDVPKLRIWLPSRVMSSGGLNFLSEELTSIALKTNSAEKTSFVAIEAEFIPETKKQQISIPVSFEKIKNAGWKAGNQISFILGLADSDNNPITVCHAPEYNITTGIYDLSEKSPLFALRLKNPGDLTSFDLWSFKFKGQKSQRGGVTILNNVINPLNGEKTVIQVDMKSKGPLNVIVMTLDGNIVQYLQHGDADSGTHYYSWDGKNKSGNACARGLYFVRIFGDGIDETRKVMIVK